MSVKETQQNMSKAEDRARAQARREAGEKFYGEFERYMMECFQKPGFKLESEQQLAVRFGVTRYKVRKAIERLNQAGVLTRRKHGGSVVTKVTSGSLTQQIDLQFQVAGYTDAEYADAAQWLLCGLVPSLCTRLTPQGLGELERLANAVGDNAQDPVKARDAVQAFFRGLAAATGNRIMSVFAGVIDRCGMRRFEAKLQDPEDFRALSELLHSFLKTLKKDKPKKAVADLRDAVQEIFEGE